MFNNSSKIIFLTMLVMGTLISISANSWLSAWMGLEINLLAFIPLMSDNKLMSTESSLKYFLTQALASSVLLFAVILSIFNSFDLFKIYFMKMMIMSSLMMKMGSAPFHFWFPNVMEGLSWMNSLILMTWQKLAPMLLISYIIEKPLMMMSIILSSIIGALGGLNQTSLRKLLAYSSINHLSWMLMALYYSNTLFLTYFLLYMFLIFPMVYLFEMFKISHITQLFSLMIYSKHMKLFIMLNLLSLGGLPPFLGFFPKWIVIQSLSMNNQFSLMVYLVSMSLITLFFYLRLCYSTLMLNHYEMKWMNTSFYKLFPMKIVIMSSLFSSTGLFLLSSTYFLL